MKRNPISINEGSRTLTIAEKLRFFRKRYGLSQMELDEKACLGSGATSKIERGERQPKAEILFRIGALLELESKELALLVGVNLYQGSDINVEIESYFSEDDMTNQ